MPPESRRPAGVVARGGGEAAGRPATDTGRERGTAAGDPDHELLVVGGDCGDERAAWATITEHGGDV